MPATTTVINTTVLAAIIAADCKMPLGTLANVKVRK